jgi:RND family efflux transporter MFP subunit
LNLQLARCVSAKLVNPRVLAALTILFAVQQQARATDGKETRAVPSVTIVMPERGTPETELTFSGDLHAWHETPIYAKMKGYVKKWYFDDGAAVTAGEIIAELETPSHDATLDEAKAKLSAATSRVSLRRAELDFAKSSYDRWRDAPKGIVSVQTTMAKEDEFEKATARLSEAVADQSAAEDDVERLQARGESKFIRAPFDGIVTERNVDIGTFVNAGDETNGKSTPPLFRVADENKIRVFVRIPEDLAAEIHAGMKARLRVPQFPGKIFDAVVDTTSRAIDIHSRTLLVELVTDNPDGSLLPGGSVQVQFNLESNPEFLRLAASTLLPRQDAIEVATVDDDNRIKLAKVIVGRSLGAYVEILGGLTLSDRVVDKPASSLVAGELVSVTTNNAQLNQHRNGH